MTGQGLQSVCVAAALLAVGACFGAYSAAWQPPVHKEFCRKDRVIQSLTDCVNGSDNLVPIVQPNPDTDAVRMLDGRVYTYDAAGRPTCMVVDGKRRGILTGPGTIRWHYEFRAVRPLKATWYASIKYTVHSCPQDIEGMPAPFVAACCKMDCEPTPPAAAGSNRTAQSYTMPYHYCTKDCLGQQSEFPLCDKFVHAGETYAEGNTTDIDCGAMEHDPQMAAFFVGLYDLKMKLCAGHVCPAVTLVANGVPVDAALCAKP